MRQFYKYHKKHHEWTAPIGIVALHCSSVEHFFTSILPAAAGPGLVKSHLFVAWIWWVTCITNITLSLGMVIWKIELNCTIWVILSSSEIKMTDVKSHPLQPNMGCLSRIKSNDTRVNIAASLWMCELVKLHCRGWGADMVFGMLDFLTFGFSGCWW